MPHSTGVRWLFRDQTFSWREWIIIRSSEDHCEINRVRNRGYRVAVSSEGKRETNIKVGKDRDGDYLKLRRPDDVAILTFLPWRFIDVVASLFTREQGLDGLYATYTQARLFSLGTYNRPPTVLARACTRPIAVFIRARVWCSPCVSWYVGVHVCVRICEKI